MSDGILNHKTMFATETAPNGVVNRDTVFQFQQDGRFVSARYAGGRIRIGYLVGTLEGDAKLEFRYAQIQDDGVLDGGHSSCRIERTADGRVRIVEHFHWETREGGGRNVIDEVIPRPAESRQERATL